MSNSSKTFLCLGGAPWVGPGWDRSQCAPHPQSKTLQLHKELELISFNKVSRSVRYNCESRLIGYNANFSRLWRGWRSSSIPLKFLSQNLSTSINKTASTRLQKNFRPLEGAKDEGFRISNFAWLSFSWIGNFLLLPRKKFEKKFKNEPPYV